MVIGCLGMERRKVKHIVYALALTSVAILILVGISTTNIYGYEPGQWMEFRVTEDHGGVLETLIWNLTIVEVGAFNVDIRYRLCDVENNLLNESVEVSRKSTARIMDVYLDRALPYPKTDGFDDISTPWGLMRCGRLGHAWDDGGEACYLEEWIRGGVIYRIVATYDDHVTTYDLVSASPGLVP
jgi:hypothetical protein